MTNLNFPEKWEKLSNDLYVSKLSYTGTIQATRQALNTLGIEKINQFDKFFKSRRKKKNLNKRSSDITKQAHSEIFFNKEKSLGVYCFDRIILPLEEYANPENLKDRDYTIMLLSELISTDIMKILIGNDVNKTLSLEADRLKIDRTRKMLKKRREEHLQP